MEYNYYSITAKRLNDISKYFQELKTVNVEILDIYADRQTSHNINYIFKFIATQEQYNKILKELRIRERRT
jgi:hypothetical protein